MINNYIKEKRTIILSVIPRYSDLENMFMKNKRLYIITKW